MGDHDRAVGTAARPVDEGRRANGFTRPHELALEGWRWRLTPFVAALLLVESLTGLWICLAPFSVASQIQVLLHTLAGLVLVVPYLCYQVRHLLSWHS